MESSSGPFKQFEINRYTSQTMEFLRSESIIAKIAFLLLVLIIFLFLLQVGINIIGYFYGPQSVSKLINGMVDAKQLIVIPQDPSTSGAVPVQRSDNASKGIEFTWSVWFFIDDLTYNQDQYKCVFYKGNNFNNMDTSGNQGLNFPNNAPGVYLHPRLNKLLILMNTFSVINEEINIDDIPVHKWVNLVIRCQNRIIDIYINGSIAKSFQLQGVPKQNFGDVFVGANGGFSGYVSNLTYYAYALPTVGIQSVVMGGPNLKMVSSSTGPANETSNYLSQRWYFAGEHDMYHP